MLGSAASAVLIATTACGQEYQAYRFDLPAQPLKDSLKEVTQAGGVDLFAMSDDLAGKRAPALHDSLTIRQALDSLLSGSGLSAEISGRRVFVRPSPAAADTVPQTDIIVTGSRIRGAPVASPVIELSQADILENGRTTLGEAVRDLPQNFRGGQNPGVAGNGEQAGNSNLNSSSTINLRGLGPDATLTLLNGHRLAYDGNVQGVDIDAIPLAALDRLEIVPDGASALYGSDAVGGVANVILKKDYEGLALSARYGGTTDGGGEEQQYTGVTGKRWESGGLLAAVDYSHGGKITASDRSYAASLSPDNTLIPAILHVSGLMTGHQSLGDATLSFDALYSHRSSTTNIGFSPPLAFAQLGFSLHPVETSLEISPKLDMPLGSSWHGYLTGTYARDRSRTDVTYFSGGQPFLNEQSRFYNSMKSVEAGLDGPLFDLFGQAVRVAIGGGYRTNSLTVGVDVNGANHSSGFGRQSTYYAFGELSVPLVSPSSNIAGIHSLSASAAVRYEDYPHVDRIATPKFGLIYKPIADLTIKGSWGKSFKAPTLYQQIQPNDGLALPTAETGATNYPPNANILLWSGGNPDLKPERATSWTATIEYQPERLRGLNISLSYFHIRYSQRITAPIPSITGVLTDLRYQDLVTLDPPSAELAAIAATVPGGVRTDSGDPYDPASIVAVVDEREHNAEKQVIRGVDASVSYHLQLSGGRSLTASGSASYLRSRQQLGSGQQFSPISGQVFFMPKWNGRAELAFASRMFDIATNISYIGSVLDERLGTARRVRAMTPIDLTGVIHLNSSSALLNKIDVTLTIQNILNDKPQRIQSLSANSTPYDSTNYPAVGRYIGATISKTF
jgi:outer membrane receptor protein involved in Fe transport